MWKSLRPHKAKHWVFPPASCHKKTGRLWEPVHESHNKVTPWKKWLTLIGPRKHAKIFFFFFKWWPVRASGHDCSKGWEARFKWWFYPMLTVDHANIRACSNKSVLTRNQPKSMEHPVWYLLWSAWRPFWTCTVLLFATFRKYACPASGPGNNWNVALPEHVRVWEKALSEHSENTQRTHREHPKTNQWTFIEHSKNSQEVMI